MINLKFNDSKNLSSLIYRLKYGGGHKKQAITKAVGTSNKKKLQIIDATCGLGTDTIILAYFNCYVYAIERHPQVFTLLTKRLMQISKHPLFKAITSNIELFTGNCIEIIPQIIKKYNFVPDVIYLDPMFNQTTKSAPNKLIQTLRMIIDNVHLPLDHNKFTNDFDNNMNDFNFDDNNLLKNVLDFPVKNRVVVKRAKLAPYLGNLPPNFSLTGKANRFDIYLNLT